MQNEQKVDSFRFVNPHTLGLMSGFPHDNKNVTARLEDKSRLLASLIKGTLVGQLVLVPVNVG